LEFLNPVGAWHLSKDWWLSTEFSAKCYALTKATWEFVGANGSFSYSRSKLEASYFLGYLYWSKGDASAYYQVGVELASKGFSTDELFFG
jgi:hypothetical protein